MNFAGKRISGNVFHGGSMRKMTVTFEDGGTSFEEGISSDTQTTGTLIPAFINAHTHIGDSFISDLPPGDIAEIFGPSGYKQRMLESADPDVQMNSMKNTMEFMRDLGTVAFIDFREGGIGGVRNVPVVDGIVPVILGRPGNQEEIETVINSTAGISASAISDQDIEGLIALSEKTGNAGKMFGIHFSERIRENVDDALKLNPSFLVHGIEASDKDLLALRKANVPVVITPRSNIMFGKRPDYSRFFRSGLNVLLGTDNCMTVEPDMLTEMAFLYGYQRSISSVSPEKIIEIATDAPRKFLSGFAGLRIPEKFIFYPDRMLTAFEVVTGGHMWKRVLINNDSN